MSGVHHRSVTERHVVFNPSNILCARSGSASTLSWRSSSSLLPRASIASAASCWPTTPSLTHTRVSRNLGCHTLHSGRHAASQRSNYPITHYFALGGDNSNADPEQFNMIEDRFLLTSREMLLKSNFTPVSHKEVSE